MIRQHLSSYFVYIRLLFHLLEFRAQEVSIVSDLELFYSNKAFHRNFLTDKIQIFLYKKIQILTSEFLSTPPSSNSASPIFQSLFKRQ